MCYVSKPLEVGQGVVHVWVAVMGQREYNILEMALIYHGSVHWISGLLIWIVMQVFFSPGPTLCLGDLLVEIDCI